MLKNAIGGNSLTNIILTPINEFSNASNLAYFLKLGMSASKIANFPQKIEILTIEKLLNHIKYLEKIKLNDSNEIQNNKNEIKSINNVTLEI